VTNKIYRRGALELTETTSFGPVYTKSTHCDRFGHHYGPDEWVNHENEGAWLYRHCARCDWTSVLEPIIDGPHRPVGQMRSWWIGRNMQRCACGSIWMTKYKSCIGEQRR